MPVCEGTDVHVITKMIFTFDLHLCGSASLSWPNIFKQLARRALLFHFFKYILYIYDALFLK